MTTLKGIIYSDYKGKKEKTNRNWRVGEIRVGLNELLIHKINYLCFLFFTNNSNTV